MYHLNDAVIVCATDLTKHQTSAVGLLVDEVDKRTRIRLNCVTAWPTDVVPTVFVGTAQHFAQLGPLPGLDLATEVFDMPEGYCIRAVEHGGVPRVFVVGNDTRGMLYGVGYLLRKLVMRFDEILLPEGVDVTTAPVYALRGHQVGYRDKTNSYSAWDVDQWDQYFRDLVVFGANAIELIPPRSDDEPDSVQFPLPPLRMMTEMSRLADLYDLDVWIWFPALDEDYGDPETIAFALNEWREVFEALPRIDAIFVPGGDPGKTPPNQLMNLLEKQTEQLHKFHAGAQMWVSPQGFTQQWLDAFFAFLQEERPEWFTGVVHGPWVHLTIAELRAIVPDQYPIRNYPDITHTLSSQFPVPNWDPAFALTIGREPINPRPMDQVAIFNYSQPHTHGFLTYCEGCTDDINKVIWSGLGWNPDVDVMDVLLDYGRYFIGADYAYASADGILALEENWRGSALTNVGIDVTLKKFQAMESAASPFDLRNWRFLQCLYRAYYDAYVRRRLIYETELETHALEALARKDDVGTFAAMAEAERILDRAVYEPVGGALRTRIFQLAEGLFQSIRMQLSVGMYQGQEEVRGANLDAIDFPLNNSAWLKAQFEAIRQLPDDADRCNRINEILNWQDPGAGGFYDDLGQSFEGSHLVKGLSYADDPAFLHTPMRKFPYRKDPRPLRKSWRCFTGSLLDAPFEMQYDHLDPLAEYQVQVVYSQQNVEVSVQLEANEGIEIHGLLKKPDVPKRLVFDIPQRATAKGALTLRWSRELGQGGGGTGCDMCEVWLVKKQVEINS